MATVVIFVDFNLGVIGITWRSALKLNGGEVGRITDFFGGEDAVEVAWEEFFRIEKRGVGFGFFRSVIFKGGWGTFV